MYSLAFSPDGALIAAAGRRGVVQIWDQAGRETRTLDAGEIIYRTAFSPDGRYLATAGASGTVRLWDTTTGEQVASLAAGVGAVRALAFNSASTALATAARDGSLRLWDTATGAQIAALHGWHGGAVSSVAISADGNTLGAGGGDPFTGSQGVKLWDLTTAGLLRQLHSRVGWIKALAFSPHDDLLAVGGEFGVVELWTPLAASAPQRSLRAHTARVLSLAFSPDGTVFASGSADSTARLWDAATGAELGAARSDSGPVTNLSLTSSQMLFGSDETGGVVHDISHVTAAASGDVELLLCSQGEGITASAISADHTLIASAFGDNSVRLFDAASGTERLMLTGHTANVLALAFSPDGRLLASGGLDHTVRLWDTTTGTLLGVIHGHTWPVHAVAFSPAGRLLASGSEDGTVRLWRLIITAA